MTAETDRNVLAFADAVLKAAEAGEYDTLRTFYTPDARLWLNTTRTWKSLDEHIATATGMREALVELRYAEPRTVAFEGGYVQQIRAQGVMKDGARIDIPACMIFRLRDGKIYEREEYFDSAALSPAPNGG